MAQQQEFHPGLSLAGAVDLESLKHQVKAEPGQAGGAPAAGGYVIDTTENVPGDGADLRHVPDPAAAVDPDR